MNDCLRRYEFMKRRGHCHWISSVPPCLCGEFLFINFFQPHKPRKDIIMTDPIITGITKDAEAGAAISSKGLAAWIDAHPKTTLSIAVGALLAVVIGLAVIL